MPVTPEAEVPAGVEPASEQTLIQRRVAPRTIAVEELEYHLYSPHRAHDALLEQAYQVWHDVWQSTFEEADGAAEVHSDEFTRQDEIGVLALDGRCVSVTGLRWLDFSLSRSRQDSYFKRWPADAMAKLGDGQLMVTSNTIVHPEWRGACVEPRPPIAGESVRLAFVTIAMSIRRFVASAAVNAVGLSRNDRSMHRVAAALGGSSLARLQHHGQEADIMLFTRASATPHGPVINDLWSRRRQG